MRHPMPINKLGSCPTRKVFQRALSCVKPKPPSMICSAKQIHNGVHHVIREYPFHAHKTPPTSFQASYTEGMSTL